MLVSFDFDGALAESDPFVELGETHGTGDDIAAMTDRMATGDVAYERGLQSVASHLEGLQTDAADAALPDLQLQDEAPELLSALQRADHHVAIVSDAPERAIESCLDPEEFAADTVVANHLPTENGAFTGEIEGPLVGRGKDAVLNELAAETGHEMGETVAVGDDGRDLPMLQAAGTGIGVDPDPVVAAECDRTVPTLDRLELRFKERNLV